METKEYTKSLPSLTEVTDVQTQVFGETDKDYTETLPSLTELTDAVTQVFGETDKDYVESLPEVLIDYDTDPDCMICDFTSDKTLAEQNEEITFTDLTIYTPQEWDWDWGDETAHGTTQNPTHSYTNTGIYTVTLTVTYTYDYFIVTAVKLKVDYIVVIEPTKTNLRFKYKIRATPVEKIIDENDTYREKVASEIGTSFYGGGEVSFEPSENKGFYDLMPHYHEISDSENVQILTDNVKIFVIKNTGYEYSTQTIIGNELDKSLKVIVDGNMISMLKKNNMVLFKDSNGNLNCGNFYFRTVNHDGTECSDGHLAVFYYALA